MLVSVKIDVLLDGEYQTSNCATLSVGFVSSQTYKDDCEKLVYGVEVHSHDSADVGEDILSKHSDLEVCVGHCINKLYDVVLKQSSYLV